MPIVPLTRRQALAAMTAPLTALGSIAQPAGRSAWQQRLSAGQLGFGSLAYRGFLPSGEFATDASAGP